MRRGFTRRWSTPPSCVRLHDTGSSPLQRASIGMIWSTNSAARAKKSEYGGQSCGGLARHFLSPCFKHLRPRRSQQAPLIPANKQKTHFCDGHHIASATAELFRRNCKMNAKQSKVARLCASDFSQPERSRFTSQGKRTRNCAWFMPEWEMWRFVRVRKQRPFLINVTSILPTPVLKRASASRSSGELTTQNDPNRTDHSAS